MNRGQGLNFFIEEILAVTNALSVQTNIDILFWKSYALLEGSTVVEQDWNDQVSIHGC